MIVLSVLIVIAVLILAVTVGILLTPIILWIFTKILDKIAYLFCKITYSKHNKINGSKTKVYKVNPIDYGFSLGPFEIGVNEPIYNGYISYHKNCSNNNLPYSHFNMVLKPLIKYIRNPIHKAFSHLKLIISRLKKGINTKRGEPALPYFVDSE